VNFEGIVYRVQHVNVLLSNYTTVRSKLDFSTTYQ